jgi:hypothetical protein
LVCFLINNVKKLSGENDLITKRRHSSGGEQLKISVINNDG